MLYDKKRVLIFNNANSAEASFAIKEKLAEEKEVLPIIIGQHELRGVIQNFLAEKMFGDYSPVRSWWRRRKQQLTARHIDRKEFREVKYNPEILAHKKMKNIFKRYNPELVVCMCLKSIMPALAVRKLTGAKTRVAVSICDYVLDKRWVHPEIDFYTVPNLSIKGEIMQLGIPEEKIEICPIPVRKHYIDDCDKAEANASLGLDPSLPTVLLVATGSFNLKMRQLVKYLKEEKLKMNILVACGYDRNLLKDIQMLSNLNIIGRNEGLDMNLAYSAADIVIARPRSVNIAMAIAKNKLLITYDKVGQQEDRAAQIASVEYTVDCNSAEEVLGTLRSYIDNKKAYIDNIPEQKIPPREASEKVKTLLLDLVKRKKKEE